MVVAMYHDQGHIPLKLLGSYDGVNITAGLPFIRTSADHGTAFDIAFVSCNSWSLEKGITTPTEEKAGLKQDLLINSRRRVLLADSSKYGSWSLFCVSPLQTLTDIVTDKHLEADIRADFDAQAFQLTLTS